ncbi:hypothetical protein BDV40DRAFT_253750 [Aspergillus tamarii]|uniref:Uncharacterized protein n=1 Tax=Aspergillus tamarii TaxID=41984 RepID=A0A5N6V8G7_ASPTM|nr:hypothetical protein BDV40DRAFT_253750 [Aspergillus tamarii]
MTRKMQAYSRLPLTTAERDWFGAQIMKKESVIVRQEMVGLERAFHYNSHCENFQSMHKSVSIIASEVVV